MNLFFWRKNKLIDVFASNLANELYSSIQPQQANSYFEADKKDKQAKKDSKKFDNLIAAMIKQIDQFRTTNSLGVYGKARLHLTFTERLKELGYDPSIAKKVNELLLLKTP